MATAGGAGLWDPLSRSQPKTFERSNWDNPSLPLSRLVRRWERCDWPRARGLVPRGYHLLTGRAGKCTRHCPRREAHLTQRGTTRSALGRLSRPHTPPPKSPAVKNRKGAGAGRQHFPGRGCPSVERGRDEAWDARARSPVPQNRGRGGRSQPRGRGQRRRREAQGPMSAGPAPGGGAPGALPRPPPRPCPSPRAPGPQ